MPPPYDAILVGAGQSGCPLAMALAAAGYRTAVIERAHVGGTCVNDGCTPTKTLVASARVAHLVSQAADYGVAAAVPSGSPVNMARVCQRQRDMVAAFRRETEAALRAAGVDLIRGEASFVGPRTLTVHASAGPDTTLAADLVILNVGERPLWPPLPDLNVLPRTRVFDSTSIVTLDVVPRHLLVVGGGYVGLEIAHAFLRLGAAVSVVHHGPQLLPLDDADVVGCLTQILRDEGMAVHLETDVLSLDMESDPGPDKDQDCPVAVHVAPAKDHVRTTTLFASHVLFAVGRIPNTDRLNLAAAGIRTTPRGHIVVDDRLATNCPGVYALGDVHGGPAFAHMAIDDYRIARSNILLSSSPPRTTASPSRQLVPYVVYTDPQLGHVGLHAHEAATSGRRVRTATMSLSSVERARHTGEPRGILKATVDADSGEILGFSCLGPEGGELMAVVQAAMLGHLRWWDLQDAVWAHPSWAESLNSLWAALGK